MILTDQLHREIRLDETPKRIISLVPSQTELLVDLGLKSSIVGVTKFCVHPENLRKQKTIIGGTKTIKIDKIKALQPDIILCNKEENSQEIIESLINVAPIHISDIYNLEDACELMLQYGKIFKVQAEASALVEKIESERQLFQLYRRDLPLKKVAYFIWRKPWMVAASNTFINSMLKEAGFQNVFNSDLRYPEISLQNKSLQNAELIFLSSEPFPFKNKHIKELREIFPDKDIRIADGELFSWYGSRLIHAFPYFKSLHN